MSKVVTVSAKREFEDAVSDKADKIIATGAFAQEIIAAQKKQSRTKKIGVGSAILAGIVGLAGVFAAPVTGGASLAATAVCSKVVVTTGALTVTAGAIEVVAGVIGVLGVMGITGDVVKTIAENYNLNICAGSTRVEFTRK